MFGCCLPVSTKIGFLCSGTVCVRSHPVVHIQSRLQVLACATLDFLVAEQNNPLLASSNCVTCSLSYSIVKCIEDVDQCIECTERMMCTAYNV